MHECEIYHIRTITINKNSQPSVDLGGNHRLFCHDQYCWLGQNQVYWERTLPTSYCLTRTIGDVYQLFSSPCTLPWQIWTFVKKIQCVYVDEAHNVSLPVSRIMEKMHFTRHMVICMNFEQYSLIVLYSKLSLRRSHLTFTIPSNVSSLLDKITWLSHCLCYNTNHKQSAWFPELQNETQIPHCASTSMTCRDVPFVQRNRVNGAVKKRL